VAVGLSMMVEHDDWTEAEQERLVSCRLELAGIALLQQDGMLMEVAAAALQVLQHWRGAAKVPSNEQHGRARHHH
jgi:hypothetical protein